MPYTDEKYARLDAARWLAAVAVVLLHSAAMIVSNPAIYGGGAWLAANLYDSAARWCVPVFVMVSGALLLDPDKPQDARQFYSRRVARICAPLLFWTFFYLTWRTALDWWDDGRVDFSFWPRKVVQGEPYYHLWYLYMIVGLYLFAPLVRILYARSTPRARGLWVVGILGVAILDALYRRALGAPAGFFLTWFLPYLGYFVAGRLIFDGQMRIPRPGLMLAASVAATALGVYAMSSNRTLDTYFYDYFSLTVPFMSLAAFQWIISSPRLPRLASLAPLTFGIYLIHPLFLDVAHRAGAFTGARKDAWMMPLLAALIFALSAASSWLLRRHPATRRFV
ncbi:O-acetyltransferase WecH [Achromobacter anxifer]|jgi:surface polysaccharide O-acyltransferase-like enzyme|uniref:acyltransferase n=1 Tax=Achromobacter anxifer TaxID=1287737 RepID=UPI00155BFD5D|nr:acyltransferase family protein [Achromobacter anxifer]CAB5516375.1 O-acetyltransferase WecH [Achromobacter anxifer]